MKLWSLVPALLAPLLAPGGASAAGTRVLETNSLNACGENLGFAAKLFNLKFYPQNNTALVNIDAVSSVEGSVMFDITVIVYGYQLIRTKVNPCEIGLAGLCPMTASEIYLEFSLSLPDGASDSVPGIAYVVPDLDAVARIYVNNTDTQAALACVEADISNGKTVDLLGVKWATAVIAGLTLLCAAIVSGLGYLNASAHVAANALALFAYFQAQAILGLTGVHLPPLVRAWTQDFQWSLGIIHVGWMQTIFRWYQRATGGTAARLLDSLSQVSVQVEKRRRSLDAYVPPVVSSTAMGLYKRASAMTARAAVPASLSRLARRANIVTDTGGYVVYGIQRVAFTADIESTNLFLTVLTFFVLFCVLTVVAVAGFRFFLELAARRRWISPDKFIDFRNGWTTVLKGILFRLVLIGFPQLTILCLWEFTQVDSAACVVLAVFFFFGTLATLSWASFKVITIARRSVALYNTPAYIFFADPKTRNKWGFLYVQFRASAYYFIVPVLAYTLVKGMIVAFGQAHGLAQAICFILVEAAALIAASVLRPWMDKTTNSLNIAICVVNFLNSICLLVFTDVFGLPGLVIGILGVILVVWNVVMSLVLLIMIIVKTTMVFFRKNPEAKYQYMADDRASFMKSSTQLADTNTELDALAATARGEKGPQGGQLDLDDGDSLHSNDSGGRMRAGHPANVALPPSSSSHSAAQSQHSLGRTSPPSGSSTNMLPVPYGQPPQGPAAGLQQGYPSSLRAGPQGRPASPYGGYRPQTPQNGASPWQRGAGYD